MTLRTRTLGYGRYRGHLAWDDATSGPRPGVLVFPEWWGIEQHARERAEALAAEGYIALAADLYGDGEIINDPAVAGDKAGKLRADLAEWRARAAAGQAALAAQPECDGTRMAAMGYCLGGSTALQLAFGGADLRAAISIHGGLRTPTPEDIARLRARLLILHGAADPFIPAAAVADFRAALDAAGIAYDFVAYPGAKHSFAVPTAATRGIDGMAYDRAADEDSWRRACALLAETLGPARS